MPGYWNEESKNSFSEDGAKKLQPYRRFDGIDENDVGMAVSYTASQLKGAWVEKSGAKENNEAGSMALKLAAAAQTGFLHSVDHEGWTEYTFASQFHKRYRLQLCFSYIISRAIVLLSCAQALFLNILHPYWTQ